MGAPTLGFNIYNGLYGSTTSKPYTPPPTGAAYYIDDSSNRYVTDKNDEFYVEGS